MKFMVIFAVLFAVIAAVYALPQVGSKKPLVLGAEKCTYGPAYWCASEQNADECNARPHCEEKVWNKQKKN